MHYLGESPIRIETNGSLVRRLIARGELPAKMEFGMLNDAYAGRPVLAKKNGDDELLERFLATSGTRLGEAFHINGEQSERAVR